MAAGVNLQPLRETDEMTDADREQGKQNKINPYEAIAAAGSALRDMDKQVEKRETMSAANTVENKSREGNLSIDSENIFPIIKKWLYTEQDIFFREIISNASDAITKRSKLVEMGTEGAVAAQPRIEVRVNAQDGTIRFIDNGIGMTMEEVDQYINRIAFSGATDFIQKYKGKTDDDQIIGHFGLGFYSVFMVAEQVEIQTLSWQPDAKPVHWMCDGSMRFLMEEGSRREIGTEIVLHMDPKSKFLSANTAGRTVRKYFEFLPYEIYFSDDAVKEQGEQKAEKPLQDLLLNEPHPLWTKQPEECTREEYIRFYKTAFRDYNDPAYWIHLYDKELGVRGIIYFKSEKTMEQSVDGLVRLYNNQVYVADNVEGIIPDFLTLQYGVIDCTKLPLMVSRSDVHSDEQIIRIENYITERIAFALYGLFECEREKYEEIWPALNPFMKYSCLKNKLFSSYVNKFVIFRTLQGKYVTLKEHLENIADRHPNRIFYVSDEIGQAQFVKIYRQAGVDALYMTHVIDTPYLRKEEVAHQKEGLRFDRIDAAFTEALQNPATLLSEEERTAAEQRLTEIFARAVPQMAMEISLADLICTETPAVIMMDEEERRVRETVELYGAAGVDVADFKEQKAALLLNFGNRLVRYLLTNPNDEKAGLICRQLYDLGRLGQETLEAEDMVAFIERSSRLLEMIL